MEAAIYATGGLLLVLILSGLGFLAIHYPKSFRSVTFIPALLLFLVALVMLGYTYGVSFAADAAIEFVPPTKIAAAKAVVAELQPSNVLLLVLNVLGAAVLALTFVSERVEREKKEIKERREKRE
jgi:hypothetical protein